MKLSKRIIDEAKAILDEGRALPDDFRSSLFEEKREYELTYRGKARQADVLADTRAVPLQSIKTFGTTADWSNMLVFGDNLQVLKTLLEMKRRGELLNGDGSPGARLCYIDPPFATRREFLGANHERAYQDKVVGAQFLEFMRKRLILIHELLSDDGCIYVHLDEKKSHYIKIILDEVFGENRFEREIVWRIGWLSGYKTKAANWIRNHDTILFYRKGASKVFNKEYLEYPKGYVRRDGKPPTGKGFPIEDTWNSNVADRMDSIQIVSFSGEKTGYPTQKNEDLLDRIVRASSNAGDLVLDAFAGSGTTAVVADRLDRRWIAIDSGKLAMYTTQHRLLKHDSGKDRRKPFKLFNAGLYDYKLLRSLPWDEFRAFALRLFLCRDEAHSVGKIRLDGFLGLDHVLVFNFQESKGAVLDESFVADLHTIIGDRVGRRFFIIAPAATVGFFQDYIELRKGSRIVRYYVLRIPYSIIDEIDAHGFTKLQQPMSESDVNDTVDSVGFDFIQPPHVLCTYSSDGTNLTVAIDEFEEEAMMRNGGAPKGIGALSMVMVDSDYDGDVFDLDAAHYAETLKANGYRFTIPSNGSGERIMLIYLDIYGNEHREVKNRRDFGQARRSLKR